MLEVDTFKTLLAIRSRIPPKPLWAKLFFMLKYYFRVITMKFLKTTMNKKINCKLQLVEMCGPFILRQPVRRGVYEEN